MNKGKAKDPTIWGLEWYHKNHADGVRRHLVYEDCLPALFLSRKQARDYANNRFGYIKSRPDLRKEPHGWRFPKPVKVQVTYVAVE